VCVVGEEGREGGRRGELKFTEDEIIEGKLKRKNV
jgi:hypothetical protein